MQDNVEWRIVEESPNYAVSEDGRIMRVVPGRGAHVGKVLKMNYCCVGLRYLKVQLSEGNISRARTVHRLVALAFLGPPPTSKHEVAHSDGNSSNNHRSNLRWATPKENSSDCVKHGTRRKGSTVNFAKLTEEQVRVIKLELKSGNSRTQREIAEDYGVTHSNISAIDRGISWKHV
jgi:hypothetical protein